jgi:hypothetical protein
VHVALVNVGGARPGEERFPDSTMAWLGTPLYEDVSAARCVNRVTAGSSCRSLIGVPGTQY